MKHGSLCGVPLCETCIALVANYVKNLSFDYLPPICPLEQSICSRLVPIFKLDHYFLIIDFWKFFIYY
jgi:uncharacterized membrane protein